MLFEAFTGEDTEEDSGKKEMSVNVVNLSCDVRLRMVVTRPVDPLSAARSDLGELTGPAVMRMTRSELSRLRSPGERL